MTTLQPMYTGAVGSPATLLAAAYIAGTSTQITLIDASVMPDASASAPNYITIRKPDASGLVTVKYTSKTGNIIGGLTVIEAYPSGGSTATYPIGSTAARKFNNADHEAFLENIEAVNTQLETHASRHSGSGADPIAVATPTTAGLESAEDKSKLDTVETDADVNILEGIKINGTDVAISGKKSNIPLVTTSAPGVMSAADKVKLNGIETAAEVNIVEIVKVNGAALAPASKAVDIPLASATVDGAMAKTDKSKLDGIAAGAQANVLDGIQIGGVEAPITSKKSNIPPATAATLGVIKIGTGLTAAADGTASRTNYETSQGTWPVPADASVPEWRRICRIDKNYATVNAGLYIYGSGLYSIVDLAITAPYTPQSSGAYVKDLLVQARKHEYSAKGILAIRAVVLANNAIYLDVKIDRTAAYCTWIYQSDGLGTTFAGAEIVGDTDYATLAYEYSLPVGVSVNGILVGTIASETKLGSVKVGAGLDVDADGRISVQQPLYQGMHGIKNNWANDNPDTNIAYTLMSSLRTPATTYNGTAARDTDYTGDWDLSWLFDDDQRYWVLLHNITSATAAGDATLVGTENYRLNPNNIFQKTDGTSAVLDGSDGDLMVCRRCMWDKYIKGTGQEDEIIVSPIKPYDNIGWYARAFEFEGTIRDRVYYGVCHATKDASNRLRSAMNYAGDLKPLVSTTIGNFETYATANNPTGTTGYSQWNVNMHDLMQVLFWLKYRSMNSQTALGYGYCNTTTANPQPDIVGGSFREYNAGDETPYVYGGAAGGYDYGIKTGVSNPAGTNGDKVHMRFDGMDDYWGNVVQWCKGVTVVNRTIGDVTKYWVKRAGGNAEPPNPASWQEAVARYIETDYTANVSGYYSEVARNPLAPLQGVSFAGGSSSKLLCDYGGLYAGCIAYSGGAWAYGLGAGVSRLHVSYGVSGASASIGGRLLYYPPELADM